MMAGTPGFQSPEQLKSENVGVESDVYAFGCLLLTIFSSLPLWPGLTPFQIMSKVTISNLRPDTTMLSPRMKLICDTCLVDKTSRLSIDKVLQSLLKLC